MLHELLPLKAAVIFHRIGPYHFARLRAAGKLLPVAGIETSGVDETYNWDEVRGGDFFERLTLFKSVDAQKLPGREVADAIASALDKIQPSVVVIPGWSDSAALGALAWCVRRRIPAVIMSESTAWDDKRNALREAVKRQLVGLASAALVGGTPHKDYMLQLGMPGDRIFSGYDAVDNGYFASEAAKRKLETGNLRPELGGAETSGLNSHVSGLSPHVSIASTPFFLSSARFVEKKNLFRLIEAFAGYRDGEAKPETRKLKAEAKNGDRRTKSNPSGLMSHVSSLDQAALTPWNLVLLGDGELRGALIARARELGLNVVESPPWAKLPTDDRQLSPSVASPTVFLPGFIQYPELPEYYGRAGAFIHASTTEQWGLVVNEAMASGLPVIVSNRCGCAKDLVQEGVNGFTFDPYRPDELARLMLQVSNFRCQLSDFGIASSRIISQWGPDRFAAGLTAAAEKALQVGAPNATLFQRVLLDFLIKR